MQENTPINLILRHEQYMDEVFPNIWLGQFQAVFDDQLDILRKHDITHVVSIGCYHEWWQLRKRPKHLLLPLQDTPFVFITDYFQEVFRFIDEPISKNQGILIHCEQGRSRSGAMVIAYLMKKLKRGYVETLNRVLMHRKRVMPNIGFQIQLRAFARYKFNTTIKYSELIDIRHELSNALRNLQTQVSRLQEDIRSCERLFVTIEHNEQLEFSLSKDLFKKKDENTNEDSGFPYREWKRVVQIGLATDDLIRFRKEWVLLVYLCHQFQLYKIAIHKNVLHILHLIGEMYFEDLLATFDEVFHPDNASTIMEYNDPNESIEIAIESHQKDAQEYRKLQEEAANNFKLQQTQNFNNSINGNVNSSTASNTINATTGNTTSAVNATNSNINNTNNITNTNNTNSNTNSSINSNTNNNINGNTTGNTNSNTNVNTTSNTNANAIGNGITNGINTMTVGNN